MQKRQDKDMGIIRAWCIRNGAALLIPGHAEAKPEGERPLSDTRARLIYMRSLPTPGGWDAPGVSKNATVAWMIV